MRLVFFFLLLSLPVHAETWRAHGMGASFTLKADRTHFSYEGRLVRTAFPLATCNQTVVQQFMRTLRAQIGKRPFRESSKLRLSIDAQSFGVKPRSSLGTALLKMDDSVTKLVAHKETACSR